MHFKETGWKEDLESDCWLHSCTEENIFKVCYKNVDSQGWSVTKNENVDIHRREWSECQSKTIPDPNQLNDNQQDSSRL